MATEKTQYVDKTDAENSKLGKLKYAGIGMLTGGFAAVISGVCLQGYAEASRPESYVDYEGEQNKVYGPISPERQIYSDAGLGLAIGGISSILVGPSIATHGQEKRHAQELKQRENFHKKMRELEDESRPNAGHRGGEMVG